MNERNLRATLLGSALLAMGPGLGGCRSASAQDVGDMRDAVSEDAASSALATGLVGVAPGREAHLHVTPAR